MEKYVRVDWPESQRWMGEDGVFGAPSEDGWDRFCVFVPEELYNKLNNE